MVLKEPIPFTLTIPIAGGLNVKDDPSEIGDIELQQADAARFDDKVCEKAPGTSKLNPSNQLESGAKLDGVWRSYADDGTSRVIAVCNGKIYEGSDWTTPIYTGLTAGKRCTFQNYRGRTIVSNGFDYPLVYNPKANTVEGAIGVQGPNQIKKVAYFETDETWTGGAVDTEAHVLDEYSGDSAQGRKLTSSGGWVQAERTGTWDYTKFDDGETIGSWDFLDVSIFHRIRSDVVQLSILLQTSPGNYFSRTIEKAELDPIEQRDYQWTHLHIRKNSFQATGSPNWNSITKQVFYLNGAASKTTVATFDNCRWRRTPPVPGVFKKIIASFETGDETWTGGAVDVVNFKEGAMGRKLTNGDATTSRTVTLDLTRWVTGQDLSLSDEIQIYAFIKDSTKITDVTLKLGDAALANYYSKQFTTFLTGTNLWNLLTAAKSSFATTGAPDWAAIAKIQIEATIAAGGEITFDQWVVIEKSGAKQISTVDPDVSGETWAGGYWGTLHARKGSYTRESQFTAFGGWGVVTLTFDAAKDLTQWDDATASTVDDFIAFLHKSWSCYAGYWTQTLVEIDCNTGNFTTDYFKYLVTPSTLDLPGRYKDGYVHIRKREFERIGTTGGKGWNTVKAIRWTICTGGYFYWVGQVNVCIDDLMLRRKTGLDGRYRWKVCYKAYDMLSSLSWATDWVDLAGERAFLHHIPVSSDSRVTQREVYRSNYAEEGQAFRYAFTIPDNTTTQYFDDIGDDHLGETVEERGVPSGTIQSPKGRIVKQFKDEIILLQDPGQLNRIYHADPYYTYAWSESNARDCPFELVGGEVSFDNLWMFLRNGWIYRIEDPLSSNPDFVPLGEIFKAVSPWGICKVDEHIAVVSDEDIKLFTGYEAISFGGPIEPYLKMANYKVEESILFYHQDHLYYAVETRAGGSYKLLDCYIKDQKWADLGLAANCFCVYDGKGDKNELIFGGYDGYIYQLGVGYNATMTIRSKDFGEVDTEGGRGFLFHDKELQEIRVIAKGKDSTSGNLTLKIYVNGADAGVTITVGPTHLPTRYTTYIIALTGTMTVPLGQLLGFGLIHATTTKSVAIKAALLVGEVKPLEQEYTG